jgi:phytanoyl-CoA hydroxylase
MSLTAQGPQVIAQTLYRYDQVHTAVPSPADLDESHVRQYVEAGFLAVENVFTAAEVAGYKQALSDLIAAGDPRIVELEEAGRDLSLTPEQREAFVRKCMWFVKYGDPRLTAMSEHPVLTGICQKLVGEAVKLFQDMALLKPPHVGREKPWHQDMAYFAVNPPEKVIGTWIALDAATPENGCMHVIPGSHMQGPKPHYHDRDCQLNDEDVDVASDVMVPLAPGGVLFFSALIHHGTPPNQSAARRRAVQLHYAGESCRLVGGEEHLKMFYDAVGYAGCQVFADGQKPRPVTGRPERI